MSISRKNVLIALLGIVSLMPLHAGAEEPRRLAGHQGAEVFNTSRLKLRWELVRNEFPTRSAHGYSSARLILTNFNDAALPPSGWALYFNTMDGVREGALPNHLALEQVGGTLFRVVPRSGFPGLPPRQRLNIEYSHPDLVIKLAKAPTGPYLVLDQDREVGLPIRDYEIATMSRTEQLYKGPADPTPLITAGAIFEKNSVIDDVAEDALPPIFPTPRRLEKRSGNLQLTRMPAVIASDALAREAARASALLKPYFPAGAGAGNASPSIQLTVGEVAGDGSPEAYELNVDSTTGISIKGNTAAGVARGVESLRDLLPSRVAPAGPVTLNAMFVSDSPRFEYRGFQLDVSRNFHSKETIFKLLDLMARYKLNKFHFHLTDDEGWRLEIPGLPELTEIGARRGHTLLPQKEHLQPAYGSGPDVNDRSGSGYYTRADYIEILRYASARHIEVIPEIEMPGHARAAVIAMESRFHRLREVDPAAARKYLLNDFEDKSQYKSPQLYNDHVMNPGIPSTYVFIEHVVSEVVAMHREAGTALRTLHVGGDELPEGAWEKSPASERLMKQLNLDSTSDLWDHFYQRVDQMLREKGLFASGWEELGARKVKLRGEPKLIPNPKFTQSGFNLFVWNNVDGAEDFAYRLANAGYKIVLAPVTKLYFDMAYNKNPEEPGVNWGGYVDIDTVYDFIPFDYLKGAGTAAVGKDGLTDYGQRNIVGLEATLFTETVRDAARIDYLIMPRMLAMAERAWAADPAWAREVDGPKAKSLHRAAWSTFVNLVGKRLLPRLDAEHPSVAYRIPPPGLKRIGGKVFVNHQFPGMVLRYTNDGSQPNTNSLQVTGPLNVKGVIKVAAFDRKGRRGLVSSLQSR